MICSRCGANNPNNAVSCFSCGTPLLNCFNQAGIKCPKCGIYGCQPITETKTKGQSFGPLKGCCGYIIFGGPLGLLCGFCGEGKKTKTKGYWICTNCGHKFGM